MKKGHRKIEVIPRMKKGNRKVEVIPRMKKGNRKVEVIPRMKKGNRKIEVIPRMTVAAALCTPPTIHSKIKISLTFCTLRNSQTVQAPYVNTESL